MSRLALQQLPAKLPLQRPPQPLVLLRPLLPFQQLSHTKHPQFLQRPLSRHALPPRPLPLRLHGSVHHHKRCFTQNPRPSRRRPHPGKRLLRRLHRRSMRCHRRRRPDDAPAAVLPGRRESPPRHVGPGSRRRRRPEDHRSVSKG